MKRIFGMMTLFVICAVAIYSLGDKLQYLNSVYGYSYGYGYNYDSVAPVVTEIIPVSTPTTDTTPDYTFTTNEAGMITYVGSCSSAITNAVMGNNTITLNELSFGTYNDCKIMVTDSAGNESDALHISEFTIEQPNPIYRFWSGKNKTHFYTASESEKNYIIANYSEKEFKYEGVSYDTPTKNTPGATAVYRFWSGKNKAHFYTASESEKNYIIANYPGKEFKYEGIAYYAFPSYQAGTQAVFRFWSGKNKAHFYTASISERNKIIANYLEKEFKYEGISWYAAN